MSSTKAKLSKCTAVCDRHLKLAFASWSGRPEHCSQVSKAPPPPPLHAHVARLLPYSHAIFRLISVSVVSHKIRNKLFFFLFFFSHFKADFLMHFHPYSYHSLTLPLFLSLSLSLSHTHTHTLTLSLICKSSHAISRIKYFHENDDQMTSLFGLEFSQIHVSLFVFVCLFVF